MRTTKFSRIFRLAPYALHKNSNVETYREDFPGAKMETKTIKQNASKRTCRNLTYVNMGQYISVNDPQLLEELEKEKDSAKAQENPYRAVLAWFLEKFPNYDDYKKFLEDKHRDELEKAENTDLAEIDFAENQLKGASGF